MELHVESKKRRLDRDAARIALTKAQLEDDLVVAEKKVWLARQEEMEEAARETDRISEAVTSPALLGSSAILHSSRSEFATESAVPSWPVTAPAPVQVPNPTPLSFVSLPKISIAKFDGEVKKWPLFFADFSSAVDNSFFSNAQKMAYLCSFLTERFQNGIA